MDALGWQSCIQKYHINQSFKVPNSRVNAILTQENNSLLLKPPYNGHLSTAATASKIYPIYKRTSPQRPVNQLMTHRNQDITVISAGHKNSPQLDLCRASDTWAIARTAYCYVPNLFSTLHSLYFVFYIKINNDKSRMFWKGKKKRRVLLLYLYHFFVDSRVCKAFESFKLVEWNFPHIHINYALLVLFVDINIYIAKNKML